MRTAFICYRAADHYNSAKDPLQNKVKQALLGLGFRVVFLDSDDMPHAERYRDSIELALRETDLVVVLVGQLWAGLFNKEATRENDDVLFEIGMARNLGSVQIMPIFVDLAKAPSEQGEPLPEDARLVLDQHGTTLQSRLSVPEIAKVLQPTVAEILNVRWLGSRWTIGYVAAAIMAYLLIACGTNAAGIIEFDFQVWRGIAQSWPSFLIYPIVFLPIALYALYRPLTILLERAINSATSRERFRYLLPISVGVPLAFLVWIADIFPQQEVPWTVDLSETSSTEFAALMNYDPAGAIARQFPSGQPRPFWLESKQWPNVFFYLTDPRLLGLDGYLEERRQLQPQFVEALQSGQEIVPRSSTKIWYGVATLLFFSLVAVGALMCFFFIQVTIRASKRLRPLSLPSVEGSLYLSYAFVTFMFWVPFRSVTLALKNLYNCADPSACPLTMSVYVHDLVVGVLLFLVYLVLTLGLIRRYSRVSLAVVQGVIVVAISGLAVGVVAVAKTVANQIAEGWQAYVVTCAVFLLLLFIVWLQYDPAVTRFDNSYERKTAKR